MVPPVFTTSTRSRIAGPQHDGRVRGRLENGIVILLSPLRGSGRVTSSAARERSVPAEGLQQHAPFGLGEVGVDEPGVHAAHALAQTVEVSLLGDQEQRGGSLDRKSTR